MISIRLFGLIYLLADWNVTQASNIPFKVTRLVPRRFAQESKPLQLRKPHPKCPGEICGTIYGGITVALLAAAEPCAAQDIADKLIDAVKDPKIDKEVREDVIEMAKAVAAAEKNVPPDFSTTPPKLRKALHCHKEPKNKELEGIVMKQDPATEGLKEFFDPKTKKTVLLGTDPRTFPRGKANNKDDGSEKDKDREEDQKKKEIDKEDKGGDGDKAGEKRPGFAQKADAEDEKLGISTKKEFNRQLNNDGGGGGGGGGDNGGGGKGGSGDDEFEIDKSKAGFNKKFIDPESLKDCKNPRIRFAAGINGRKKDETTFIPISKKFEHGEALDLSIITRSSCDKLLNCDLDKDKKDEIFNKCKDISQDIGSSKNDGLVDLSLTT
ncbi:hypothetical protein PtB15_3B790 [Puccinia triticina]|nr:hypothetical protein PtB15_3B790 [Puccinia triticina]